MNDEEIEVVDPETTNKMPDCHDVGELEPPKVKGDEKMTTETTETTTQSDRVYFTACEDENCEIVGEHNHGTFRPWRLALTEAQRAELGQLANIHQKSLSWVAENIGVSA